MKNILQSLFKHKNLTRQEAKEILTNISKGQYNAAQIASFLTVFNMRHITLDELSGFRDALLDLCLKIDLSAHNPMDVCGTGGDEKNTFNISTLTSFIVAGAGIPVAKHGNYGVSSISGSSNVLEYLGFRFETDEKVLKQHLTAANICFLHAPLFHPAMKSVGAIRKEMASKTFFNMLGPLVNPAKPKFQMVGVFNLELARMYQYLLQNEDTNYTILYGLDGFDEISLTDKTKIITNIDSYFIEAADFGIENIQYADLFGGNTIKEAANIFMQIIEGKGTKSQNEVVLINAAMAIKTYKSDLTIDEARLIAKESLFNLNAKKSFNLLKNS
jgi:anthranilate phosphoribosyltransferase